ncbi:Molybdopterin oxidoreductase, iron-sulfur binding subunit (EC [Olavius sp. associated proteobacterium Delta 1]|nr:Molybdopterin oxidoreductase, iron-sulfur binding subunit (EC [Olavius sp. associated proteobacterium Delta 1]
MKNNISRRNFLKVSALGGASMVIAGCPDPIEKLIPLQQPPYNYVSGVSTHFATTCRECSAACGLVVRTREGRAIKAEGNPRNPVNEGRICLQGQSALQGLYSPSRAVAPVAGKGEGRRGISWKEGKKQLADKLQELKGQAGGILYLGPPRSGTFPQMLNDWLEGMGGGRAIEFDLTPLNSLKTANRIVFGQDEIPHFAIDKAEVLINFGADFLESWLNPIQLTKAYTRMHNYQDGKKGRYIHIAPHMSLTGTNADEWISCPRGYETMIALALSRILLKRAGHLSSDEKQRLQKLLSAYSEEKIEQRSRLAAGTLVRLADEFEQNGRSLAMAGGNCNAGTDATRLQIAVSILNYVAGNIGNTVVFGAEYRLGGNRMADLESAVTKMKTGRYQLVIIENVNPVFTLPENSGFKEALQAVPYVVSLSTENDETSELADMHLPTSHFLESWGDARPRNGVYALQQPVMARVPGIDTMDVGGLLLELARLAGLDGFEAPNFRDYIKASWKTLYQRREISLSFAQFWTQSLQKGGHYENFKPSSVALNPKVYGVALPAPLEKTGGLRLLAVNSNLHNANARGGNRSWLLEIPHPVTQVVWDSWVELHPDTAVKLGIRHGDLVEISSPYGKAEVAAWVFYGIDKECVAMPAGMGRKVPFPNYKSSHGKSKLLPVIEFGLSVEAQTVGVNVMNLLPWRKDDLSGDFVFAGELVSIKPTGKQAYLVTMDGQYRKDIAAPDADDKSGFGDRSQKGRGFVQVMDAGGSETQHAEPAQKHHGLERFYTVNRKDKKSFYDPVAENVRKAVKQAGRETPVYHDPYKWEMIIDLDRCTGCSACVAACYAENNIPPVGKDRSNVGREMSWLRMERYFEKNRQTGQLETYYSPQMCQQCDNAGCEPVCPVFATYQTPDGLNGMVYNRCVGSRYCSNNCVYKQRRFNWRSYQFPSPLHLQLNPAVSVRSKGVMEKCTFCHHRIREMKDLAKDRGRDVKDGEIQTACQQACPADAISFGNILDKNSNIRQIKEKSRRQYTQLPELNFQPAITYLKKVNLKNQKA